MQSKEKDNLIILRLFPEEDVFVCLKEICQKHKIKTAVVLSGLGQLASFSLGFFREKGDYAKQDFNLPHELLSLTGNVSRQKDGYDFHLHSVLSNEQKQVVGGHFINGIVSITAEIVLLKTNLKITRCLEPATGLSGLFLE